MRLSSCSGLSLNHRCDSFAKLVLLIAVAVFSLQPLRAQDLTPRAYVITPIHSNAVILTWSFYDGSILFDGTAPTSGASFFQRLRIWKEEKRKVEDLHQAEGREIRTLRRKERIDEEELGPGDDSDNKE